MHPVKVMVPVEDSAGAFYVFEHTSDQLSWPEVRGIWVYHDITLPLCFVPPETRLDLFFFYACQSYGVPASLGTVYNPAWSELFLKEVCHDCLVITDTLISYVISNGLFAHHMDQFRVIICIGDLSLKDEAWLLSNYHNLHIAKLPNPLDQLMS